KTYAEKNSSARSIFIILVLFRRRRPAETEERQVRDGVGVDPVGNDGWGDAAAGWNRSAVRVLAPRRLGTAGRAAGDVGHPSVRGGPHRRPRALPPLRRLLRGQCFGAQNQQQSGHTAADTSISLPEDLNAMVGDLCFLLGSHPCPLMSLTMDWLPLK
ncbi:unnamed protein product, partial [Musa textilis]